MSIIYCNAADLVHFKDCTQILSCLIVVSIKTDSILHSMGKLVHYMQKILFGPTYKGSAPSTYQHTCAENVM